jgi:hypothetical protein
MKDLCADIAFVSMEDELEKIAAFRGVNTTDFEKVAVREIQLLSEVLPHLVPKSLGAGRYRRAAQRVPETVERGFSAAENAVSKALNYNLGGPRILPKKRGEQLGRLIARYAIDPVPTYVIAKTGVPGVYFTGREALIAKLQKSRKMGLLTNKEFKQAKKEILSPTPYRPGEPRPPRRRVLGRRTLRRR